MMLAGVSDQHAIAIVMIGLFGLQAVAALLFLLYKLYKKVGFRPRSLLRRATARRRLDPTSASGTARATVSGGDSSTAIQANFDKIIAGLEVLKSGNASLGENVDSIKRTTAETGSDVKSINVKLQQASNQAMFWNISSLVFGVVGVVIGILTL